LATQSEDSLVADLLNLPQSNNRIMVLLQLATSKTIPGGHEAVK
jgi:hypothetical protein